MTCAIWSGESKPLINEYLQPIVAELKELLRCGITSNLHHISIKIGKFLCDSPARSLIKGM